MFEGTKRLLSCVLVGCLVVNVALLVWGSQETGVSWDETAHVDDLFGNQNAANKSHPHFGVYGVSFQLIGHAFAVGLGAETVGDTQHSAQAYLSRHLASVTLTVFTALCVALMTFLITKRAFLGAWAGVALLSVPVFLGHGMFNPKDIPVAAGYTSVTLFCVSWLKYLGRLKPLSAGGFLQMLVLGFGVWLSVGTRYIFMLPIIFSILATSVLGVAILLCCKAKLVTLVQSFVPLTGGVALGFASLWLTNPCRLMPNGAIPCTFLQIAMQSVEGSADIAGDQPLFMFGELYPQRQKPAWALPVALFAGVPTALILMTLILLAVLVSLWGATRGSLKVSSERRLLLSIPIFLQMIFMPLATVLSGSPVYDMQRQHLYVYPALLSLVAITAFSCLDLASFRKPLLRRQFDVALGVLLATTLTLSILDSFRLYPYNYTYVNSLLVGRESAHNWETDYWALSLREAISSVPPGVPLQLMGGGWSAVRPFLNQERGNVSSELGRLKQNETYVLQIHRPSFGLSKKHALCRQVSLVRRMLHGKAIPMSYVLICPRDLDNFSQI